MIENQIACTETSALVGGSQSPTLSRIFHNPGIGIFANRLDANTNPAINNIEATNLRKTIKFPSPLAVVSFGPIKLKLRRCTDANRTSIGKPDTISSQLPLGHFPRPRLLDIYKISQLEPLRIGETCIRNSVSNDELAKMCFSGQQKNRPDISNCSEVQRYCETFNDADLQEY